MQHRPPGMLRRFVSTVSIVATVVMPFATFVPSVRAATTLLTENFGTSSNASDIPGWDEEGVESDGGILDAGTFAKQSTSGNNSASPDGGRFAMIGNDEPFGSDGEWICREVVAVGYQDLALSYYWRGDNDAESHDEGRVEYSTTGVDCDSATGWSELREHELNDGSEGDNWASEGVDLSEVGLDNAIFFLRFRNDAEWRVGTGTTTSEQFRVDGVTVTGEELDTTPPEVSISSPAEGEVTGPAGTIIYSIGDSETVSCTLDGSTVTCDLSGEFNFELADGGHTFTVTGEDAAGNDATDSVTWTVTEDAPPVCPDGQHLEGEVCVPDDEQPPACDEGYEWNGEECVPAEPTPTPEPCGGEEQEPCESPSPTPESESGRGGGGPHPRATLIVEKVIESFGEDASVSFSDFSFWIDGDLYEFEEDGANELRLRSGDYKVTEELTPGYTVGYSGDCDENGLLSMIGDETYTCVVTNTLGVGGFNPGSEIPAPTPTPTPGPGGGSGSGGTPSGTLTQGDESPTPTVTPSASSTPEPDESIASNSQAAAIGGFLGVDLPWWLLLLLLLVLWWWFRRSRTS